METIGQFFIYALMGIFVENAVFTRALGVGRVIFIGNIRHIGIYCAFLTATTSFSSLIAYAVQNIFYDYPNILAYRPLFLY